MRLGAEVVDLVRLEIVEQLHHLHGIGQVAVVQEQARLVEVRILVDVVDAGGVEGRGATHDAVNLIAFGEKEFRQIRTVLPRDARDECFFHGFGNCENLAPGTRSSTSLHAIVKHADY